MGADNLTGQYISDSYQKIVTISDNGEYVTDGTGSKVESLPITSSYANSLSTGNKTIRGNLTVLGHITASKTVFLSASIIYESGSSNFGNSIDDKHRFTGSIYITGSINGNGAGITGIISSSYSISSSKSIYSKTASFALGQPKRHIGIVNGSTFTGGVLETKIRAITFPSPFINNKYGVFITGVESRTFTVVSGSNTASGFTISSNSTVAFATDVFWAAIQSGSFI